MSRKLDAPPPCSPEITEAICLRIAGGESLLSVCRDPAMPVRSTVYLWLVTEGEPYETFQKAYNKACRARAYGMADEITEISDDSTGDVSVVKDAKTGEEREVVNHEHIQRSKLRVDSRKWLAGKFLPDQFGDRVNVGGVAERPIETKEVGRNEIARRIAFALMGRGEEK